MNYEPLHQEDLNHLAELQPVDWSDIVPYFHFYTASAFCFPIKITIDQKIVGVGTSIIHNDIYWLAHIITHPEYRNQGIGRLIVDALINQPHTKRCETVYLIATDLGAPVYEKAGFETETEYLFFKEVKAIEPYTLSKNILEATSFFKSAIAELDLRVSGENRMFHLEPHLDRGYVYVENKKVEGYYLPTFGEGMINALTPLAGVELMKLRMASKVIAGFPADNIHAIEFMHSNHYQEFKIVKRMRLGKKRTVEFSNIFNRIGGNLG